MQKSLATFYLIIFLVLGVFVGFVEASIGNATHKIYYGTNPIDLFPKATVYVNADSTKSVSVLLPGRSQSYFLDTPSGFMPGWIARLQDYNSDNNDDVVVTGPDGCKYIYLHSNGFRINCIKDSSNNTLVTYYYENSSKPYLITKQEDSYDYNLYIEYVYNTAEDRLTDLIGHDNNTMESRPYTIYYNTTYTDEVESVTGSCSSCGGMGGSVYLYDDDHNIQYIKDADDDIMYEMTYTDEGLEYKYIGSSSSNNIQKYVEYSTADNGDTIVDIYEYIISTPTSSIYRVVREYKDIYGNVTKRIKFTDLNDDPDSPSGDSYTENFVYTYASGVMTKKIAIPASASSTFDPEDISGVRKEYTYDSTSTRLTEERWFDSDDDIDTDDFVVSSYEYDPVYSGSDIVDYRIDTYTDALGSETQYNYSANTDAVPASKFMPQFTDLSSNTLQLKYSYTYDDYDRVTLEEQKDYSGNLIVATRYEYDNYGNLERRTDSYNDEDDITEYEYNGFNNLIKQISPSGVVKRFGYNSNGKLDWEAVVSPTNDNIAYSQTEYHYDNNGRLDLVKKAKDDSTFTLHSPDSWISTSYYYDLLGNKTEMIEDVGGFALTTTYDYNNQNELTKVTLPTGKWTKTIRDGRGLVSETQVGFNTSTIVARTYYVYDADENITEENFYEYNYSLSGWECKSSTKYEYDDFGRVSRVTKGLELK